MSKLKHKYNLVYKHLWQTYGSSGKVRFSYCLQIITRICKLVALPIALSLIIARLSGQDYEAAQQAVWLFVVFSLTLGILSPLVKYIGMLGENQVYRASTADYFARLVAVDLDYFNSNLSGYLTTATRQYVDSCVILVRSLRDRYINTILSIIFPLVVILWLDIWLGLIALVLSVVQAAYLVWASNVIAPFRTRSRELYKENSGRMADVISNILAVRSNAQEKTYVERVKNGANEESEAFRKRYTVYARLMGAREFITVMFFMVLLWLTVERMSSGVIDIRAAVLVVTYTTTILTGIYSLADDLDDHDDFVDKIIPAFEILDRKNNLEDPITPQTFTRVRGEITLKNVSFKYDKDQGQAVFENFSLTIPHGQKIGIVGLSGAGKSTLTKLLLRFNDVDEGAITIDDIDIRTVKQTDLRQQVAYVPQEPLLFHTSIKENVLLARPTASEKEIREALGIAHALTFVEELPQGLDSIVGERGVKLSGGQKQRVAIARAVLRHAPIMILDEATSALDSESEQIIKNSFQDILKGKTAIVVAHRLSTLSEMDRIIVIDQGQLVEDGSHETLLKRKGIYANLWQRQQKNIET
ncbi:ABC transporter ATP-binding protein [Candidatus Berkelbacteria bacterium]|nr:ABC transporter ATP-binding protein [Candidatus Berkelbacteria bacterium]